jgi:hypothetical protein
MDSKYLFFETKKGYKIFRTSNFVLVTELQKSDVTLVESFVGGCPRLIGFYAIPTRKYYPFDIQALCNICRQRLSITPADKDENDKDENINLKPKKILGLPAPALFPIMIYRF